MARHKMKAGADCCAPKTMLENDACCRVEALVTIDARGQIVLPKDFREKAELEAGDKLALIGFESDGKVCCISLIKADAFAGMVKGMLGPMMNEVLKQ